MYASYKGRTDIVRILVDAGADLNWVDTNVRKYFNYKSYEIFLCVLYYLIFIIG